MKRNTGHFFVPTFFFPLTYILRYIPFFKRKKKTYDSRLLKINENTLSWTSMIILNIVLNEIRWDIHRMLIIAFGTNSWVFFVTSLAATLTKGKAKAFSVSWKMLYENTNDNCHWLNIAAEKEKEQLPIAHLVSHFSYSSYNEQEISTGSRWTRFSTSNDHLGLLN